MALSSLCTETPGSRRKSYNREGVGSVFLATTAKEDIVFCERVGSPARVAGKNTHAVKLLDEEVRVVHDGMS